MKSKITGGETELLFTGKVLNQYEVQYFRCLDTGFIQTEEPYWLKEAYSSAITKLDIGLVFRNETLREKIIPIINKHYDPKAKFLDYAGGYGLFTRLMRDKGYNFFHTDVYCQNLFAEYFDLTDLPNDTKFELLTAFEVFEHLPNPLVELEKISTYSDNILFSTVLQPGGPLKSFDDWWYFIPETGQHVALYTENSLAYLAEKLGYYFYSDGIELHLFTKIKFQKNPFLTQKDPLLIRKMKKWIKKFEANKQAKNDSLLGSDFQFIKSKIS